MPAWPGPGPGTPPHPASPSPSRLAVQSAKPVWEGPGPTHAEAPPALVPAAQFHQDVRMKTNFRRPGTEVRFPLNRQDLLLFSRVKESSLFVTAT